jgi:hypothetical protein
MKQTINKYHKGVLNLAALLSVTLFFMAVLPWLLYGEGFWEQSILFNILGVIIGVSWFLLAVMFIYGNITMFIPKLKLHNLISAINLALFLSLLIFLDSDQIFDIGKGIMYIAVICVVLIVINIIQYMVYKNIDNKSYEVVKESIKNYKDDNFDQNKVSFLYHYFIIGLFVLYFIDLDVIFASVFYLVFVYIYFRHMHMLKTQVIIYLSISVLLVFGVIFFIVQYDAFFQSNKVFETLLMTVPLLHLMPPIVKVYHKNILKQLVGS